MENKKIPSLFKKIIAVLFFLLFFGAARSADAASLYFSPSEGSFYANENFTVSVFVNAEVAINAAEGVVNFPTEFFEAISLNYAPTSGSIVNLWVQNPSFSNSGDSGNVSFAGVVLNPGFAGPAGKIIDIVFRVKKGGSADLAFTNFAILANDGLGTNVSTPNGKAQFTLFPARVLTQKPEQAPLQKQDIKEMEQKVQSLENKITQMGQAPGEETLFFYWNILPKWLKIGILGLIGTATLVLSLIILSFGIIVLVWIWSRAWRKRKKFARTMKFLPGNIRTFFRRILITLGWAREEIEGDVNYSFRLVKRDFKIATDSVSLTKVLKNYWASIIKIFRRFRKRNVPRPEE